MTVKKTYSKHLILEKRMVFEAYKENRNDIEYKS